MSAIPQTDLWLEFFDAYRQLPALWRVTDEVYKNHRMKKAAYDRLLECYRKIDPKATVEVMRRRINGIRTCFRRELRKVEQSEQIAHQTDDVYVPHLWYFNELSFLRADDSRITRVSHLSDVSDKFWNETDPDPQADDEFSNNDLKDDEEMENISEPEVKVFEPALPVSNGSPVNQSPVDHLPPPVEPSINVATQFQPQVAPNLNHSSRDEADIFAEGWAITYRKLDGRNKLLAKKAIEEILFLGQINKLEFNSVKMPN
ncbi:uncharacterized protein [Drosophila virilis]|uniref:MADF domain-containing protein n=1 Tax=Drosophila virilis TaxID=7244 RepID=B4LHL7_DROVI|nr:uncharacterized protein LOC6622388 [Drosophila virilis]EDW69570.1 uncharacterized protein Dvir_GJ13325 [Drosophila virilis]